MSGEESSLGSVEGKERERKERYTEREAGGLGGDITYRIEREKGRERDARPINYILELTMIRFGADNEPTFLTLA